MNTSTYTATGIAAIVLAILFPVYWLFGLADLSLAAMRADFMTLNGWDLLFVVIGALEIIVYVVLARFFRDQLGGALASILLMMMAVMVAIFHATVVFDVFLGLGLGASIAETIINIGIVVSVVSLILYTFTALTLAIVLLTRFAELPTLIRAFSIGLLLACIFQLTVFLAVINIFLFPLLMLFLAAHFLRGEHPVEVV